MSPTPWHRLFGIALTDLFIGRPWRVELELELAIKSQRLDVLIIERLSGQGASPDPSALAELPDGLDTLGAHNILTYKSSQESLNAWALDELIGHYVTYRKLVSQPASPTPGDPSPAAAPDPGADPLPASTGLRPATDFRLFAVATHAPQGLLRQLHPSARRPTAWPGVYDLTWGQRPIRLIVLNAIAAHPRNAPWELFASELTRVRAGLTHYQPRDPTAYLLRYYLETIHHLELSAMAYTLEDFRHDTLQLLIKDTAKFTPDERDALLARMDIEDRLRGLNAEERLRGLNAEERLRGLDPEEVFKRYAPEDILRQLDPAAITAWLKRAGH